nr:MAG TPA: hypothetical protein [Caudoviricetes sp.]DAQ63697.1 MAG TPA: hypothetical protein [Caudoviricetes sp.]DAT82263.1 MAG TPA: hypothetical protein [Caudoviricetes sp.]DAZ55491.1 MAG TPA: hypothetical protein [Caudoviricetes sp.]
MERRSEVQGSKHREVMLHDKQGICKTHQSRASCPL